jgi:hypothetical protein
VKFKLDENLPVSSAAILTSVGHDVDTITDEGLIGAPDRRNAGAASSRLRCGSRMTSDLEENLPASALHHLDGLISAHTARD